MARFNQEHLRPEVDRWIQAGWVTPTHAEQILSSYPLAGGSRWMLAFSIIGSLLVLAGIILLIAHNWQEIPALLKFVVLLILLIGSTVFAEESRRRGAAVGAWESGYLATAVFPLLGFSLISQIFHIDGDASTLLVAWWASIAVLPLLSRSVASWVVWWIALTAATIAAGSEWIFPVGSRFSGVCFLLVAVGGLGALASGWWIKVQEKALAATGQILGMLVATLAWFIYGFDAGDGWFAVWFLLFLGGLGMIYRGYVTGRSPMVNLGFTWVGIVILSTFFRLVGTMLDTGLIFLFGGLAILGAVIGLNRARRQVLKSIP